MSVPDKGKKVELSKPHCGRCPFSSECMIEGMETLWLRFDICPICEMLYDVKLRRKNIPLVRVCGALIYHLTRKLPVGGLQCCRDPDCGKALKNQQQNLDTSTPVHIP